MAGKNAMIDIRKMSNYELDQLNKNKRKKNMSTTTKTEKKTIIPRAPRNPVPAFKRAIGPIDPDVIKNVLSQPARGTRSGFTAQLSELAPGDGIEVEGDLKRLRTSAANFGRSNNLKFRVTHGSESNFVYVIRARE